MAPEPKLRVARVRKVFAQPRGDGELLVLEDLRLEVRDREIVSLVGPSACGKSTLLHLIAGFERPNAGEIVLNGARVTAPGPDRGVVFQSPALFPWLDVWKNVTAAPRAAGVPPASYGPVARALLRAIGLEGFERHYPYQLSGGQRQRVQLARVLINTPEIILMDEPFGALDFQTRLTMQEVLLDLWAEYHPSILFVTHDVDEAIFVADRVYVMSARPGRIVRELQVPFPKPRRYEVTSSAEFVGLRREVLGLLRGPGGARMEGVSRDDTGVRAVSREGGDPGPPGGARRAD